MSAKLWQLTRKESLTLQAMVRRAGLAPVLDDLSMLADEMGTNWQQVHNAIWEAREEAFKALSEEIE